MVNIWYYNIILDVFKGVLVDNFWAPNGFRRETAPVRWSFSGIGCCLSSLALRKGACVIKTAPEIGFIYAFGFGFVVSTFGLMYTSGLNPISTSLAIKPPRIPQFSLGISFSMINISVGWRLVADLQRFLTISLYNCFFISLVRPL